MRMSSARKEVSEPQESPAAGTGSRELDPVWCSRLQHAFRGGSGAEGFADGSVAATVGLEAQAAPGSGTLLPCL